VNQKRKVFKFQYVKSNMYIAPFKTGTDRGIKIKKIILFGKIQESSSLNNLQHQDPIALRSNADKIVIHFDEQSL